MWRYIPSIPTLVRVFIMNGCWILSDVIFFASIEMILWFLSFVYVVWCIDWFVYVEPFLVNLGSVSLGHGVWSFLCVVGFGLLIFCWEFLHLYSSGILACNFVLSAVFVWFWYQGDGGFIECYWECSFLLSLRVWEESV